MFSGDKSRRVRHLPITFMRFSRNMYLFPAVLPYSARYRIVNFYAQVFYRFFSRDVITVLFAVNDLPYFAFVVE